MRKMLILLFFAFSTLTIAAQESSNAGTYQPTKGKWQVELNFMPWNTDVNNVGIDQLTIKYKLSNRLNLRMGVTYSGEKEVKDKDPILDPSHYNISEHESNQSLFGIKPGIELHFLKDSRISPYIAVEYQYINKKSDYKRTTTTNTSVKYLEIDGGQYGESTDAMTSAIYDKDRAYKSTGVNILLGTDVYICKNFYAGFELGFGYEKIKYGTITIHESAIYNTSNSSSTREIPQKTTKTTGIFYNNAIRIGVWF